MKYLNQWNKQGAGMSKLCCDCFEGIPCGCDKLAASLQNKERAKPVRTMHATTKCKAEIEKLQARIAVLQGKGSTVRPEDFQVTDELIEKIRKARIGGGRGMLTLDQLDRAIAEIQRLESRIAVLEKVRDAAGYLPVSPENCDRSVLNALVTSVLESMEQAEDGE